MDLVNQAKHYLNVSNTKEESEKMKDYYPEIAKLLRSLYEECKKVGFNEEQSFFFAKEYLFKLFFK